MSGETSEPVIYMGTTPECARLFKSFTFGCRHCGSLHYAEVQEVGEESASYRAEVCEEMKESLEGKEEMTVSVGFSGSP